MTAQQDYFSIVVFFNKTTIVDLKLEKNNHVGHHEDYIIII